MKAIDHFNLRNFDLNLLLAFDALMQELSVTHAATRLHIQQPAMSHSLATLRLLMQDPLFVRTGSKMEPTPRALALFPAIRKILQDTQDVLMARETFDPAEASGTFHIGINAQLEVLLLPLLLELLRARAPGMHVVTSSVTSQTVFGLLDEGAIDLAIGYLPGGHSWHHRAHLLDVSHVCCYKRSTLGHAGPITLAEYLNLPHGFVSAKNSSLGYLEGIFASAGVRPQVVISSPNLMTLAASAERSPILITISSHVAQHYAAMFNLAVSPLPFELPHLPGDMLWHSRSQGDPANEWLRTHLQQLTSQLLQPARGSTRPTLAKRAAKPRR